MKRFLSLLIAVAMTSSILLFDGVNAWAQLKEAIFSSAAGIANTLADTDEECDHDYRYQSALGSANCVTQAYITFACTKCGATKKEYTALGHYYVPETEDYRAVNYKCSYCESRAIRTVEEIQAIFDSNTYKEPVRNNDNCFADVVSDGHINAKDYAYIRHLDTYRLTNPNADATSNQVYNYICRLQNAGKTLSAQQESTWMGSEDYEFDYIYNNTGKYPAMRGLDYMNDDFYGVNRRAISYWNRGGLVTICWHMGPNFSGEWSNAMNDEVSDWNAMLTEGTQEYQRMIAGMDKAASALSALQDAGVTVLWRPFHEFDGAWFWWGKGGYENFVRLWRIMYDRYTNYWHLNNLIWVLGYSHMGQSMASWNPGAQYYDIIGVDTYTTSEFYSLYTKVKAIAYSGKPIVLHECGTNPNPKQFDRFPYTYFMTWHTTYLTDDNKVAALNTLYNSERVITLDEVEY